MVSGHVQITYACQAVPSPLKIPHFETFQFDGKSIFSILSQISHKPSISSIQSENTNSHNTLPNFTGEQVKMYMKYSFIMLSCNLLRITLSGCYSHHNKSIRYVQWLPEQWKSESTNKILKVMHLIKYVKFFSNTNNFQKHIVSKWNMYENHVSEFIIP